MKRTAVLNILHDTSFPVNKLVIHPNTGFDLGFMQVKYKSKLFINCKIDDFKTGAAEPFVEVDILLLNECGPNNIEIAQRLWEKVGKPDKALLIYEEEKNEILLAVK